MDQYTYSNRFSYLIDRVANKITTIQW